MAMTLRLDDAETEALRSAAELEGVSMQEFARRAIREATSQWHPALVPSGGASRSAIHVFVLGDEQRTDAFGDPARRIGVCCLVCFVRGIL